jgi:cathepsin L
MKVVIGTVLLGCIAGLALFAYSGQRSATTLFQQQDWEAESLFMRFIAQNQRLYMGKGDYERRFTNFKTTLAKIDEMNANPLETATFGITALADLSDEEFKQLLGAKPDSADHAKAAAGFKAAEEFAFTTEEPVLRDVNWVTAGKVAPIQNQGNCGSCWSFSAAGVLSSNLAVSGITPSPVQLSEQQLVNCSWNYGNNGCSGGMPARALNYFTAYYALLFNSYPYTATDTASCEYSTVLARSGSNKWKDAGVNYVQQTVSGLKAALDSSPVSIVVDASNW